MLSAGLNYPTLFLISSIISLTLGVNVLLANKKETVNRIFFTIALMLSIWSFGFAIEVNAPDAHTCLLWRRVAAIGWTLIYALLVHYASAFTGSRQLLSHWWGYCLLYFPAIILLYVFALSDKMTANQYTLVCLNSTWVNVQVKNGWDYLFYGYFFINSLVMMIILLRKYRSSSGKEKRLIFSLLASIGIAIALGSLTDLLNTSMRLLDIPQMAPVAFLIPIGVIYYSMRRYSLMVKNTDSEQEIILSKRLRNRLYFYFSIIPAAGGVVYFISEYWLSAKPLPVVLTTSICFVLIGVFGTVVYHTKNANYLIDPLFIIAAATLIPFLVILDMDCAGVSVRALPFIFIIFSMLFNDRNLLISTSISSFISLAALSIMIPSTDVHIERGDYLIYAFFLFVGIWVAFFVSRTYLKRLAETALNNRMQTLVSDVSKILLTVNKENQDGHIEQVLSQIGKTYKGDTVILWLNSLTSEDGQRSYIWEPQTNSASVMTAEVYSRVSAYLRTQTLDISNAADIGNIPQGSVEMLNSMGLTSMLSIPLDITEIFFGFMAVGTKAPRLWTDTEKETFSILVNNLSESFVKLSAEWKIEFLAYHDFLTQLPNRELFRDRTHQAIRLAERLDNQVGVVFLDLDSFKTVNDLLGHKAGDELIVTVAAKLTASLRKSDTVARFGGDEFLLLLQNINNKPDLEKIMNKIIGIFDQPIMLQGQEIYITASAGVAIYPQDGDTTDVLIKNADIAMYSAKDMGKNQYLFCSEGMKEEIQYKAKLTNLLHGALDRNEFKLMFQPQVDLQTNRIIGAEALLRWNQAEMGFISPNVFIPLAEKTGLINLIGEWSLLEACRQLKKWHEQGLPHIRMAVNVSVNQLRNPFFVDQVKDILQKASLEPGYLELEVTESVATSEPAYIIEILTRLKALGVLLSIDDFGTQYSSLSRLKQLPVDRIKIDMQFVQGIDTNEKDKAISKVIISLAKSLNLRVIAEGVENQAQLAYLSQKKCDEVQGFLFFRPLPAHEMEQVLRNYLEDNLIAACMN